MGKQVRYQAESLGLTKIPPTILYAQPRHMRALYSRFKPDIADKLRDMMKQYDPSFIEDSTGGGRNNTFYLLAPEARLYVEVNDRSPIAIGAAWRADKHVSQIKIFSSNKSYIREIAHIISKIWDDEILIHMDWEKIEKKYNIKREDAIIVWKNFITN